MNELCCIVGCKNSLEKPDSVKAYAFPKNPRILKKWVEFSGVKTKGKIKKARICELHFKSRDLITPRLEPGELLQDTSKILKPKAVPTLKRFTDDKKDKESRETADQVEEKKDSSMQQQQQVTQKRLGRTCIVQGCRSNKKGCVQAGAYPTFRIPAKGPLREEWLRRVGKPVDFPAGRYTTICIKHFKKDALMQYYALDGKETSLLRNTVKLKPDAIPTEFPGIDHHIYSNSSKNMNSLCCVNNCESHLGEKTLPLFQIPKDPILRSKWITAIPKRSNWKFNPNMKICSDHFKISDFLRSTRKKNEQVLQKDAIPSIFPEDDTPVKRKLTAEEEKFILIEKEREEKAKFYFEDLVSNFEKLTANYQTRISKETLMVFRARITNTYITFYRMSFEEGVPSIKSSLTVTDRMDVSITMDDEMVDPRSFESILNHGVKLIKFTELENLLKAIADGIKPTRKIQMTYKASVNMLKKTLDDMIEESDNYEDDDSNELQKMLYHIYDQINAVIGSTRYSIEMLIHGAKLSCMGHSTYYLIRSLVQYPSSSIYRTYMATDENHRAMNARRNWNLID